MKKIARKFVWPVALCIGLSVIYSSFIALSAHAASTGSIYMEELTWMEIRDRLQDGTNAVIVPLGGTEQNGPHLITGKHNHLVRYTAGEIAKRSKHMLVAPVIAYVPEGRIDPPEGHMQFPGTISVTEETLSLLLQDAAASLKQNGFSRIYFIGDHGGSQDVQKKVAQQLSEKWESGGVKVVHIGDYYGKNGQDKWAQSVGLKVPNPSAHAGFMDTSEMLKIYPQGVRDDKKLVATERDYKKTGASGDSTAASSNHGRQLLELKIQAAVNQISRTKKEQ